MFSDLSAGQYASGTYEPDRTDREILVLDCVPDTAILYVVSGAVN
jgi:hypothetical protein